MKIADYKGYIIAFNGSQFYISGVDGHFDTMQETKAKIDAVVSADSKAGFPVDVITSGMHVGKITSYNREENMVWFSGPNGRSKERVTAYAGQPHFFTSSPDNLAIVKQYQGNVQRITELEKLNIALAKSLSEPLTFPLSSRVLGNKD